MSCGTVVPRAHSLTTIRQAACGDLVQRGGLMRRAPIAGEIVFWLLGGAGVMLAIWQYASMVSTY